MSLVSRLKDLVRANLNDLISKAEDPEKSLNLYIDDATENLRQFSVEVNRFEAERILVTDRIRTCEATIADWHSKAKLALQQNREDLAQKALESEQKEKKRLEQLQSERVDAEQTSAQMKEQYQLLEQKLAEAKERRDDLVRRNRRAVAQKDAADAVTGFNKDDPLSKFDRMETKVERREAEAQASYTAMTSSLSYEMDQLKKAELKSEVDDAMAKLKQELQSESNESAS
ncbi:PspA/IM30 family protein [Alicyclobacillus tolerans]|uniref:PspA/IM30 family protein n=1 Tax=Alicyclobacillus tolerans TaxID=90970 RepID=UPI001F3E7218|nr:PspA/IM30 family protein [Alicyclobacillus tolerans]MCF8565936.1 PspA/IM30 family protein [Alicyclobacillus tolerans]